MARLNALSAESTNWVPATRFGATTNPHRNPEMKTTLHQRRHLLPRRLLYSQRHKAGFTFVELALVVIFISIFAAISIPRLHYGAIAKQKADCTARKIVTDLRRTRTLAVSHAADNTDGYALNMSGPAPYFAYEIIDLDSGTTIDSHIIDSDVTCTGGSCFEFGPLGNLLAGSDTSLVVSGAQQTFTVTVISATGMVECTEN